MVNILFINKISILVTGLFLACLADAGQKNSFVLSEETYYPYFETGENKTAAASDNDNISNEIYFCGPAQLDEAMSSGITMLSHVRPDKSLIEEAHARGIKLLLYISIYKALDFSEATKSAKTSSTFSYNMSWKEHPFWKELDASRDPSWILLNEKGERERPFHDKNYDKGVYVSCPTAAGLKDAYLKGIDNVMKAGYDGVFIDNVCSGYNHHLDQKNKAAYLDILQGIYQKVKTYGKGKYVLINGRGNPFMQFGDAGMLESYICSHLSDGPRRAYTSGRIYELALTYGNPDMKTAEKPITALSYVDGKTCSMPREDAIYTYACAVLSGFMWTCSGKDTSRMLYRARLGAPLSDFLRKPDDIWSRFFQKGFVLINTSSQNKKLEMDVPKEYNDFVDAVTGAKLETDGKKINIEIEPQSGKVYIRRKQFIINALLECQCQIVGLLKEVPALAKREEIKDIRKEIFETLELLKKDEKTDYREQVRKKLGNINQLCYRLISAENIEHLKNNLLNYAAKAYMSLSGISCSYSLVWDTDPEKCLLTFNVIVPASFSVDSFRFIAQNELVLIKSKQENGKYTWIYNIKNAADIKETVFPRYLITFKDKDKAFYFSDYIELFPEISQPGVLCSGELMGATDELTYVLKTSAVGSIVVHEPHPMELIIRQVGSSYSDDDFLENLKILVKRKENGQVQEFQLSGDKIIGNKSSAAFLKEHGRGNDSKRLVLCRRGKDISFNINWIAEYPGIYEIGIQYDYTDPAHLDKGDSMQITHWLNKNIVIK